MIRFGIQLWPETYREYVTLEAAFLECEGLGFDSAWLYDHFYPMIEGPVLEPWTTLPALAVKTRSLRLGALVTCNSFRYPSILAKMAATLDSISGGRLEFAIGAGWYEEEYKAYGIPFPSAIVRIRQLNEAVEIIRRLWTEEEVTFRGEYCSLERAVSEPKPIQKPHPPIWIGGGGPKVLEVVARHADYCNFLCSPEEFRRRIEFLGKQCSEIGRDPNEIEKTWHGPVFIADNGMKLKERILKRKERIVSTRVREMPFEQYLGEIIAGTPEQCIEKIQRYIDVGVTYFIPANPSMREMRLLAERIMPAFR